MTFRSTLQLHGKTATGFEIPDEVVAQLGDSKRPAVRVTLNGHTYRSTIAKMGGTYMLGVSAENRLAAQVAAGDAVEVTIELDTQPRDINPPADFALALSKHPAVNSYFDSLAYSHKRRYVEWIEGAKAAETRERRINQAVETLTDESTTAR